jgi:hypothetical protein
MAFVMWHETPPYGVHDLKPQVFKHYQREDPDYVRNDEILCCIQDCRHWLKRRCKDSREFTFCPKHHIGLSRTTYIHQKSEQNLIIFRDLFRTIRKTEDRLANENSEDALTWNIFVGLYVLQALDAMFTALTGIKPKGEPELYLWGNRFFVQGCSRWESLGNVQQQLEAKKRFPTEPDCILRIPGQALIFVEAKFRSANSRYDKKTARCGPVREYLKTYRAKPGQPDPLNREWILRASPEQVLEQLCRNTIVAQWLAEPGEQIFLVNLVSNDMEKTVEEEFRLHLAGNQVVFRRFAWEWIPLITALQDPAAEPLIRYMVNKTHSLKPAFPSLSGLI